MLGVCVKVTSVCFIGQSISSPSTVKYRGRVTVFQGNSFEKAKVQRCRVCLSRLCLYLFTHKRQLWRNSCENVIFAARLLCCFMFFLFVCFQTFFKELPVHNQQLIFILRIFLPPPFFYHGKQFLSCDCRGEDLFLTVNWSEKRSFLDAGRCKRWGEDKVKWSSFFKNNLVFLGDVNDKPRTFFIAGCPCLWMRVLSPDTELSR